MHGWRNVIGSALVSVGSVVVLAQVRNGVVDVPTGAVLVLSLVILARSAIRLAADPARRDVEPPSPRG
jgi:hypothetical protein